MRKLHPVGAHEVLLRQGRVRRPDGAEETWTLHALPGDRRVVRVEVPGAELWHLTLEASGAPERLELRLIEGGRTMDATFTFFEDEALVWRRGAEPAAEAIALPPGYRLLWPPVAGREVSLVDLAPDDGSPSAVMTLSIVRRPAERGWLRARPVKFTVRGWRGLADAGNARSARHAGRAGRSRSSDAVGGGRGHLAGTR
jgi:hypothetical protein